MDRGGATRPWATKRMTKEHVMTNTPQQTESPDLDWAPETVNEHPIKVHDQLWWADLNGYHAARWVTVCHFDHDDGLIICRDHTSQHYMTVPEELTQQLHRGTNMKSLLDAVSPIINSKTAKVTLDISAASTEGELMVIVKPIVGPVSDKASEELKLLSAALAQPLKIVGEPQEIEAKLAQLVQEQTGKRNQWANRAAQLDAAISAAAASDSKKTGSTPAAQTAKPMSAVTVNTETSAEDTAEEAQDLESNAGFGL